jgi:hypothetical protein
VTEEDNDRNLASLYIYAIYWVLTVVTTVGYGHASYSTSTEMLYACFLEVVATLLQALSISILQTTLTINKYSYQRLLFIRMNEVDEWLAFKIQKQRKPDKMNKIAALEI